MTEEFIEKARESEPAGMICEGTRMTSREKRKNHSEQQVKEGSNEIFSNTNKIVFVTHYSRDMNRLARALNNQISNHTSSPTHNSATLVTAKDEKLALPTAPNRKRNTCFIQQRKPSFLS